jgi:3-oxoacyl-[acyl-carrier-protein] synthase II
LAASLQATADAGIAPGVVDPELMGVIIGSGIGGLKTFEDQHDTYRALGPGKISPFFIPMFISDIAAGVVSMRLQAKGPNYATVSACSTSAHAIGEAFRTVQYGDADVMIAGGSEAAVTPMSIGGFANMGALSTRNDAPTEACRPFDKDRDGFVMGEGAGVVVLEELEHARRRGARIYGEVVGYRATGDAYHLTGQPDGHEGLQRAMRGALRDASLAPEAVDYINAHGTSTPLNDPNESLGIATVFGAHARVLSVSSTKSMTGHMLGAAGSVEFIACALAIRDQQVPPTINYRTPDPSCDLDYTPNVPRARTINVALSNSSGFGGHNVSLALRRFEG